MLAQPDMRNGNVWEANAAGNLFNSHPQCCKCPRWGGPPRPAYPRVGNFRRGPYPPPSQLGGTQAGLGQPMLRNTIICCSRPPPTPSGSAPTYSYIKVWPSPTRPDHPLPATFSFYNRALPFSVDATVDAQREHQSRHQKLLRHTSR